MLTFAEYMAEQDGKRPLYMKVVPDKRTQKALAEIQKSLDIQKPINVNDFHVTQMYSKKPVVFPRINRNAVYDAAFEKFDIFVDSSGKRVLVIKLTSKPLLDRHNNLMAETGGSYDYPKYLPHVTLSYDCGNFDPKLISTGGYPLFSFTKESAESLDTEWNSG